jgi:hypothetical protein
VALFSGLHLTDRNLEVGIHTGVRRIVSRLVQNQIDEADATRQLTDLLVRAMNAKDKRTLTRSSQGA